MGVSSGEATEPVPLACPEPIADMLCCDRCLLMLFQPLAPTLSRPKDWPKTTSNAEEADSFGWDIESTQNHKKTKFWGEEWWKGMKYRYEGEANKINKTSTAFIVHDNLRDVLLTVMVQTRARKMREVKRKQQGGSGIDVLRAVRCGGGGCGCGCDFRTRKCFGAPSQHNTFTGI